MASDPLDEAALKSLLLGAAAEPPPPKKAASKTVKKKSKPSPQSAPAGSPEVLPPILAVSPPAAPPAGTVESPKDRWAWSSFQNSPDPDALPMPEMISALLVSSLSESTADDTDPLMSASSGPVAAPEAAKPAAAASPAANTADGSVTAAAETEAAAAAEVAATIRNQLRSISSNAADLRAVISQAEAAGLHHEARLGRKKLATLAADESAASSPSWQASVFSGPEPTPAVPVAAHAATPPAEDEASSGQESSIRDTLREAVMAGDRGLLETAIAMAEAAGMAHESSIGRRKLATLA